LNYLILLIFIIFIVIIIIICFHCTYLFILFFVCFYIGIVSLSSSNAIHVFNNNGILLWSETFSSSSSNSNSDLFIQEENIAYVLVDGILYARSLQTGKALWQRDR